MKMEIGYEDASSATIPIGEDCKRSKRKTRKILSKDAECQRITSFRQSLMRRAEIQALVDYANPKLVFHQMSINPFGKNRGIAEHFNLLSYDGMPSKNLVLCKICKRILIRFKNGTSNLKAHLERHKIPLTPSRMENGEHQLTRKPIEEKAEVSDREKTLILDEKTN